MGAKPLAEDRKLAVVKSRHGSTPRQKLLADEHVSRPKSPSLLLASSFAISGATRYNGWGRVPLIGYALRKLSAWSTQVRKSLIRQWMRLGTLLWDREEGFSERRPYLFDKNSNFL